MFIPPGIWTARMVVTRINQRVFDSVAIAMLPVSSALLLVDA